MIRVKFTPASERTRIQDYVVPGDAAVYQLPDGSYVWLSTSCVLGDWETYAFPCDANGNITSWGELDGSMKHDEDHPDPHAAVLAAMAAASE